MKFVAVINLTRPLPQPLAAGYCASFLCRLRGLMFRRSLPPQEGLLLVQGRDSVLDSSIHMMFMNFPLAVVWVNAAGQVVDVRRAEVWRPAYFSQGPARYVLELHLSRLGDFQIGDQVRFE